MEMILETPPQIRPNIQELLDRSKTLIEEGKAFLQANGTFIELDNYLTIKRYCEKYGLQSESIVTNWIRRGVIAQEDIKVIEELNGLRLIKDKPYR
ncbi:MAG: hypothetical protein MUF58_08640 [Arcicella sp.]|jgi:hypothetical protein|nr:hypothetical protein [Arcicella sp.]